MSSSRGRKPGRFYPEIEAEILETLRDLKACSINEVSDKTGLAWDTVRKYLIHLNVKHRMIGKNKLWIYEADKGG